MIERHLYWTVSLVAIDQHGFIVHTSRFLIATEGEIARASFNLLDQKYPSSQGFMKQRVAVNRIDPSLLERES